MRDELDVVDAVRHAAEVGRVARDDVRDPHRLRVLRRPFRRLRHDGDLRCAFPGREGRRKQVLQRRPDVDHVRIDGRNDADLAPADGEPRVRRRLVHPLLELRDVTVRSPTGDLELAGAAGRK